jgi:hypothetical protein
MGFAKRQGPEKISDAGKIEIAGEEGGDAGEGCSVGGSEGVAGVTGFIRHHDAAVEDGGEVGGEVGG